MSSFLSIHLKKIACRDLNIHCDFIAEDETVDGVIEKALQHGQLAHAKVVSATFSKMSEKQVKEHLKSKVRHA